MASGKRSWHVWLEEYSRGHRHPINRACHAVGIPLVAVSIAAIPVALLLPVTRGWIAAAFGLGWFFQLSGHIFERKPPEFLKGAQFLLVGLHWWLREVRSRLSGKRVRDREQRS